MNLYQKYHTFKFSVARPVISASNGATSYELSGPSVTLTCTSTSGSGDYVWRLNNELMYVTIFNLRKTKTFCFS